MDFARRVHAVHRRGPHRPGDVQDAVHLHAPGVTPGQGPARPGRDAPIRLLARHEGQAPERRHLPGDVVPDLQPPGPEGAAEHPHTYGKPKKTDCDEYPFASTYQGAARAHGNFSVMIVPDGDNRSSGSRLGNWYATDRVLDGDPFYINVVGTPPATLPSAPIFHLP
ncbi:NucA/NucB deoxyribonuclease domain-containing protein [Actinoallomurus iriomotensis]|uniref:Deoxyribonuclease NucA/NucB domain-containing protein n=1 Tax=Actinoallomurus iriomotensis TaxID=478107 RepID=A0A9W6RKU6_9ACTN|nr:NucA/NucB deoxyribonuclease domain-containing protein [Actinoallomurus iriomotensis]GLY77354.1 hypothetical protein Airi01_056210 [Actinoallomurus iriomotensis]